MCKPRVVVYCHHIESNAPPCPKSCSERKIPTCVRDVIQDIVKNTIRLDDEEWFVPAEWIE